MFGVGGGGGGGDTCWGMRVMWDCREGVREVCGGVVGWG